MAVAMKKFDYLVPSSVDEAIAFWNGSRDGSQYVSGGTELMPMMNRGKLPPVCLIELTKLRELSSIEPINGGLRIGASVTHTEIEHAPLVINSWQALAEASGSIREPQVRNRGTIGGNVASGVSCADLVPALLVFGAEIRLKGSNGERLVPIEKFLVAPFKTDIKADELVTHIQLSQPEKNLGSAFTKLTKFHGSGLSVATVAAAIICEGDKVRRARIAIGAAGPVPKRAIEAEAFLEGKTLSDEVLKEAGRLVSAAAEPREGSIRASPTYKHRVLGPLAGRTITLAFNRSRDRSSGA